MRNGKQNTRDDAQPIFRSFLFFFSVVSFFFFRFFLRFLSFDFWPRPLSRAPPTQALRHSNNNTTKILCNLLKKATTESIPKRADYCDIEKKKFHNTKKKRSSNNNRRRRKRKKKPFLVCKAFTCVFCITSFDSTLHSIPFCSSIPNKKESCTTPQTNKKRQKKERGKPRGVSGPPTHPPTHPVAA